MSNMKNLFAFVKNEVKSLNATELTSFIDNKYYEKLLVNEHGYQFTAAKEIALVCAMERKNEISANLDNLADKVSDLIYELIGEVNCSNFHEQEEKTKKAAKNALDESDFIDSVISKVLSRNIC